jgi:hypothetical protein
MIAIFAPALLLASLFATLAPMAATAAESGCATRPSAPEVIILIEQDPITVNEHRSLKELQKLFGKRDAHPSGIYKGSIGARWSTASGVKVEGSRTCIYLARVEMTLRLEKPTIWLGSDLAGNRCVRESVWQHEIVHYRIDQALLDRHAPLIEQAIREALRRTSGVTVSDQREAKRASKQLADAVDDAARWSIDNLNWERDSQQDSHDSPAEYARTGKACADGNLGGSRPLACDRRPGLCTRLDQP